jgi:protein SCO1/2
MVAMSEERSAARPAARGRRLALAAAASLLALVIGVAGVALVLAPRGPRAPDFTLTDQSGRPFRLSDLRGHAVALFFGYTHCPDVCPTTLAALARAKRKLGADGTRFDVVFVTVDPRRDTPAVVGKYVRLFDPSFIGLSGTEAQLAPVYAAYKVYHQVLPAHGSAAGYLVAHGSSVDFIGPHGRIRGSGDWSDTPSELAVKMKQAES